MKLIQANGAIMHSFAVGDRPTEALISQRRWRWRPSHANGQIKKPTLWWALRIGPGHAQKRLIPCHKLSPDFLAAPHMHTTARRIEREREERRGTPASERANAASSTSARAKALALRSLLLIHNAALPLAGGNTLALNLSAIRLITLNNINHHPCWILGNIFYQGRRGAKGCCDGN